MALRDEKNIELCAGAWFHVLSSDTQTCNGIGMLNIYVFYGEVNDWCLKIPFRTCIYYRTITQLHTVALSEAQFCRRSLAGIAGSNHAGARILVSCECFVMTGTDLCDRLILHPEKSY